MRPLLDAHALPHQTRVELLQEWQDAMQDLDTLMDGVAHLIGEGGTLETAVGQFEERYTDLLCSILGDRRWESVDPKHGLDYDNALKYYRFALKFGAVPDHEEPPEGLSPITDCDSLARYMLATAEARQ